MWNYDDTQTQSAVSGCGALFTYCPSDNGRVLNSKSNCNKVSEVRSDISFLLFHSSPREDEALNGGFMQRADTY